MTTISQPSTPSESTAFTQAEVPAHKLYGIMAEFTSPAAIYEAAKKVRSSGYRWWDCCTPFPVHGLDRAMGVKNTILPWLVFGGGITGATLGLVLQWFTNGGQLTIPAGPPGIEVTGYPFLISGKPFFSLPAWIPVIFELTVLLSALGAVFLMLLLNGLPMHYHPLLKSSRFRRVTDDRFFLVIEARDPRFYREKTREFLESLHPTSIEELES